MGGAVVQSMNCAPQSVRPARRHGTIHEFSSIAPAIRELRSAIGGIIEGSSVYDTPSVQLVNVQSRHTYKYFAALSVTDAHAYPMQTR